MAKEKRKFVNFNFVNYWTTTNYLLLGIGIILLVVGYYLMSVGSWDSYASLNISPIILLLAYLVVLPAAILYNKNKKGEEKE